MLFLGSSEYPCDSFLSRSFQSFLSRPGGYLTDFLSRITFKSSISKFLPKVYSQSSLPDKKLQLNSAPGVASNYSSSQRLLHGVASISLLNGEFLTKVPSHSFLFQRTICTKSFIQFQSYDFPARSFSQRWFLQCLTGVAIYISF